MKTKSNRQKKIIAIATVAALAVTLILGGTFAMQDFNQHKTNNLDTQQKNMDVTLKEIFEPVDNWQEGQSAPKTVSVVNVGEADNAQPVYVRLKLSEYLDIYHVNYVYKMDPETADPSDTTKNLPYRFMTDEDGKFITFPTRAAAQEFLRDDLGIDETIPQLDARIVRVDEEPYLKNSDGNGHFYIKTQFGDVNGQYGKYLVINVAPDGDHSDFGYPGVEVVAGNEYWAQKPNRDEGKSMFAKSTASDWERDHFDLYDADAPARDYVTIDWEDMILLADWVDSGAAPVAMWIYDPDGGYFYWGEPLDPKIETGPLMSGVTLVQRPEGSLFYSLRVDMETVILDQLDDLTDTPQDILNAWQTPYITPIAYGSNALSGTNINSMGYVFFKVNREIDLSALRIDIAIQYYDGPATTSTPDSALNAYFKSTESVVRNTTWDNLLVGANSTADETGVRYPANGQAAPLGYTNSDVIPANTYISTNESSVQARYPELFDAVLASGANPNNPVRVRTVLRVYRDDVLLQEVVYPSMGYINGGATVLPNPGINSGAWQLVS